MLDFGKIFVKSSITKSFSIYNDLPQCVWVELQLDPKDTSIKSHPASQVIPGANVAGFDLSMSSASPQTVDKVVVWTINGLHTNKMQLRGEIVPVSLNVSQQELKFTFRDDMPV